MHTINIYLQLLVKIFFYLTSMHNLIHRHFIRSKYFVISDSQPFYPSDLLKNNRNGAQ